jgi:hypothetical protein
MEEPQSGVVTITDLARPQFSSESAAIRDAMASVADLLPLSADALRAAAMAETGLSDFGARDYEERLDLILECYRDTPGLTASGTVYLSSALLNLLKNRLRLTDLLAQHPEILDIDLAPPIIIAGLPRTGTTHLLQMMAASERFRVLPFWEAQNPFPPSGADAISERREALAAELAVLNEALPHFKLMHEMTEPDHVQEELLLLAHDFSTMFFETLAVVPRWRDYYLVHDQAPHYAYMRVQLQALQFLRDDRRWLLKCPQHFEQLPTLATVFPRATVILTHRDPVQIVTSLATMLAYLSRLSVDPVEPAAVGEYWADRVGRMLDSVLRDRDSLPPESTMDLRFDDFMADDIGAVRTAFDLAGEDFTHDAETKARTYLDEHRRGYLGRVQYDAAAVGLDTDQLRERFAAYSARFLGDRPD